MDHQLKVYISHASEDQQESDQLHDFLRRDGFLPWLCEKDVQASASWREEMDRALKAADVFLYLVSCHSTTRQGQFQGELERALDLRKSSDLSVPVIIPLWLDNSPLPRELQPLMAIDYSGGNGYPKLLHALQNLVFPASRVVFSLHGMGSRGKWQKELVPLLSAANFKPVPLDYGMFLPIQLLFGPSRRNKVVWLLNEYNRQCARSAATRPSIIAHSLGSYLLVALIHKHRSIRFDRVVLCGAILHPACKWENLFASGQVRAVLNQYGGQDLWARIVAWVVDDAGPSGYRGFDETTPGLVQQYNPEFGHSDYFNDANYRGNWIPFLQGQSVDLGFNPAVKVANWRFRITLTIVLLLIACGAGYALRWLRP